MGFTIGALGPADQAAVRMLQHPIVSTLRTAAMDVRKGSADERCRLWFGDVSAAWKTELATKLNKFASVINTTPITVNCENWREREKGTVASALRPQGGWNTYTNLGVALTQGFTVNLDMGFSRLSTYRRVKDQASDTKFQSLIHELSHLILGTDDHAYGPISCRALALGNSAQAKTNADSWGYFVEDCRA
jgi:hypothetical protein